MGRSFRALNILRDGEGPFHANRFRTYFKPIAGRTLADLADDFVSKFVKIFNGRRFGKAAPFDPRAVDPSADNTHLPPPKLSSFDKYKPCYNRVAQVQSHTIDGRRMLQFTGDLRVFYNLVDFPDVHDDWVGEVWRVPGVGMAVQTQKVLESRFNLSDALIPLIVPPILIGPAWMTKKQLEDFNATHFLAGCRSWVLGEQMVLVRSHANSAPSFKSGSTGMQHRYTVTRVPYWYLETAALERFSSVLYQVVAEYPEYFTSFLPDIEQSIQEVWLTMLYNFVRWYQVDAEEITPNTEHWPISGPLSTCKILSVMKTYPTLEQCLAEGWVQDLLAIHPALKNQLA